MTNESPFEEGGIWGVYLAAGKSNRMGCHKLSLPVEGTPLGSIALQTALRSELTGVLVVTTEEDKLDWIAPVLQAHPFREKWRHLPCPDAAKGQAHSLRCGLQGAQTLQACAVLILLADQPFISVEMINDLIHHLHRSEQENQQVHYVASSYHGIPRPPILFSSALFPALLALQGDEGARKLVRNGGVGVGRNIAFFEARLFVDIDTPTDYERLLNG